MTLDPPGHSPGREGLVARHLDPVDRLGEFLFGLIMVLSFTLGAGWVVGEGPGATRSLVLGVVGCNVAWGLIDGAMYMMSCAFDRSLKARMLANLKAAGSEEDAVGMVASALDDRIVPLTSPGERRRLYGEIVKRLERMPPERTRWTIEDLYGAMASFWLVVVSTIPAVAPFLVFRDAGIALRVSNLLLLTMMFLVGWRWARVTRSNPWLVGSTVVLAGLAMVGVSILLGG